MHRWLPAAILAAILSLLAARGAAAQPDLPELKGLWKPELGKGAVYQVKGPDETVDLTTAVVGLEADGVWLEEVVSGEKGLLVVKVLLNPDGVQRLIIQPGEDGPALELPPMGAPGKPGPPSAGEGEDVSKTGTLVGEETITTPAGTFTTQHFRVDDTDVWVTADIPPLGIVKSRTGDLEITLVQLLTDAKSRITKEPRKLRPGD